jgi:ribonuclease H2 subunit A
VTIIFASSIVTTGPQNLTTATMAAENSQDASAVFQPPSVVLDSITQGQSYTHMSAVPNSVQEDMSTECVLGIDEAGRGPVLGIEFLRNDT